MKEDHVLHRKGSKISHREIKGKGKRMQQRKEWLLIQILLTRRELPRLTNESFMRVRSTTSTPSAATLPNTEPVPIQTPPPVAPEPPVVPPLPRLLNRLKGDGLRTILEEKFLFVEGLEGEHAEVLDTLMYHEFEQFRRPRDTYIPSWVRKFYLAYEKLVPKNRKKDSDFRLVKSVMGLPVARSLDDLKGWLALMISDTTPRWMDAGTPIEKRDMNIASRYWFGFISNTIMPSQNKSILRHQRVACLGSIMSKRRIDMGLLISQEMAVRAKQMQTTLPSPVLIIEFCRCARVPQDPASDIEVTPFSSTDIRRTRCFVLLPARQDYPGYDPEDGAASLFSRCVAYLKATNFTTLMGGANDKDTPNIFGTPPATMGDMQRDAAGHTESEMEIDEEQIAVHEEVVRESQEDIIFRDLPNLEEMVVQSATQSMPVETSTTALSRSGAARLSEATPS
ncbi:hypothetical protein H5410_002747 [Solanum commersonii]|uniref:Putative plant transposon protein domain-containing protein n=1 Tax=Solanum commersonii TaxID=4109 RepID=A0A9J6B2T4_SOLCO|nr:hypothetical protein H5410_002747 [Solanum commersonii]